MYLNLNIYFLVFISKINNKFHYTNHINNICLRIWTYFENVSLQSVRDMKVFLLALYRNNIINLENLKMYRVHVCIDYGISEI